MNNGGHMIQTTEQLVYNALLTNRHARQDDFILYGVVLKKIGISLNDSIGSFLATAKKKGFVPSFETVSRCRRKLQANNPALVDEDAQKERKEAQERFKEYSRE